MRYVVKCPDRGFLVWDAPAWGSNAPKWSMDYNKAARFDTIADARRAMERVGPSIRSTDDGRSVWPHSEMTDAARMLSDAVRVTDREELRALSAGVDQIIADADEADRAHSAASEALLRAFAVRTPDESLSMGD